MDVKKIVREKYGQIAKDSEPESKKSGCGCGCDDSYTIFSEDYAGHRYIQHHHFR